MGALVGLLIRAITFPGLVLDYYINKKVASLLSINIAKDDFSKVFFGEALEIDSPNKYYKLWLFSFLPFLVQTLIALIVCYFAAWALFGNFAKQGKLYLLLLPYLGISIAAHAFPDSKTATQLWKRSNQELKNLNLFGLFAYPYVILIFIIRILHVFWIDILYGVFMIIILKDIYFYE